MANNNTNFNAYPINNGQIPNNNNTNFSLYTINNGQMPNNNTNFNIYPKVGNNNNQFNNNNITNFGNQQNSNNNLNYNQNSFNNINNNNNFGKYNQQSSGVNRSININQQIKIIFESDYKIELYFPPNTTIEDALNGYKNLFRSQRNFDFVFNEDKIDQYSKDLIGDKLYNNCSIQVIEK